MGFCPLSKQLNPRPSSFPEPFDCPRGARRVWLIHCSSLFIVLAPCSVKWSLSLGVTLESVAYTGVRSCSAGQRQKYHGHHPSQLLLGGAMARHHLSMALSFNLPSRKPNYLDAAKWFLKACVIKWLNNSIQTKVTLSQVRGSRKKKKSWLEIQRYLACHGEKCLTWYKMTTCTGRY